MTCAIRQQSQVDALKWNEFVYSNSMGWAYHLYEMIGVDRYASYVNCSFAVVDTDSNDEILMILQLHRTDKYPVLSKLRIKKEKLHSRWGYVLKDGLPRKQLRKVKECFENYIDQLFVSMNIRFFDISLPPLTQSNIDSRDAVNPLIYFNFEPQIRYSYVVDLSKPDDRMLADCEETTRQAIRKSEACGRYEVIEAQSTEQDCKTYIDLHKETYTRTGARKYIIADAYHRNMFFNLLPKGICRVFFLYDKEAAEIISSVAILIHRNTAYYWWGNSRNEKEVGINKYLLFKAMCIVRESFGKTGYFETGGAYVHLRKGKDKGLNDFKKCFGTFLLPIYAGKYSPIRHKR